MSGLLPLRLEGIGLELGGRPVLDGIDMKVPTGLITVVLGANGAGKSTLLRLCHGLLRPTRGRIVTGEGRVGIGPGERARQSMLFQRPVHLRRSALRNLTWVLAVRGASWRARRGLALAALRRFDLEGLADRPAPLLSGGEQQRLALARAWLAQPELLILDEPTAGLDPAGTRAVELAVRDFADRGIAVLLTTHDLGQARRLAEKIAFLHGGRLLEAGSADRFFQRPLTPEGAAFLKGELLPAVPISVRGSVPC
jgi:tungstate transport system ATP-binding protein